MEVRIQLNTGHPLVAPDRDAQPAHVLDQRADGGDLLVAPRQAALGLVQRRAALDHRQREAGVLVALLHAQQRHVIPGLLAAALIPRQPADRVRHADLLHQCPQPGGRCRQNFCDFDHDGCDPFDGSEYTVECSLPV